MKAVVMAGGQGTRLRPLTWDVPKPLLTIGNRPVLEHVFSLLDRHGFTEAVLTVRYLSQAIAERFGDRWRGVSIRYCVEPEPLGTAGSVRYAVTDDEPVLVISGDALTNFHLGKLVEFHRRHRPEVTIAVTAVDDPSQFGTVVLADDGSVLGFVEKPSPGSATSDLVNTGIYVVEPSALAVVPPNECYDFARDLFPRLLAEGRRIAGCQLDGYWCDIGDAQGYLEANIAVSRGRALLPLSDGVSPTADIRSQAEVELPAIVGDRALIEPAAFVGSGSVVGRETVIGARSQILESVIGNRCRIGRDCRLVRTVIGDGVAIGDGTVIGENSVLARGVRVGDGCVIRTRVRIWPDKRIEAGQTVTGDIFSGHSPRRLMVADAVVQGATGGDIGPEAIAVVARALAGLLGRGRPVLIGSNGDVAADEMRKAALAGLCAGGALPLDGGQVPRPAFAVGISHLGAAGGIYLTTRGPSHELLRAEFFGASGDPLDRKLEYALGAEVGGEPPVVKPEDYHGTQRVYLSIGGYLDTLTGWLDPTVVRRARFRGTLLAEKPCVEECLLEFARRVGAELADPVDRIDRRWVDGQLGPLTGDGNRDFCAALLGDGTQLVLSAGGRVCRRDDLIVVLAGFLIDDERVRERLYVPADASGLVQSLARERGLTVVRTRRPPRGRPEHLLWADGLAQLYAVLYQAASLGCAVADLLPSAGPRLERRSVNCSWKERARVLRQLAALPTASREVHADAVRIVDPRGWAVVRPDPRSDRIKIVCEADDAELAAELTGDMVRLINRLAQRSDDDAAGDRS